MTVKCWFDRAGTPLFGTAYEFESQEQQGRVYQALREIFGRDLRCIQGALRSRVIRFDVVHARTWLFEHGVKKSRLEHFQTRTSHRQILTPHVASEVTAHIRGFLPPETGLSHEGPVHSAFPPSEINKPDDSATRYSERLAAQSSPTALVVLFGTTSRVLPPLYLSFRDKNSYQQFRALMQGLMPSCTWRVVHGQVGKPFDPGRVARWFERFPRVQEIRGVSGGIRQHYAALQQATHHSPLNRAQIRTTLDVKTVGSGRSRTPEVRSGQPEAVNSGGKPQPSMTVRTAPTVYEIWIGDQLLCGAPLNLGGAGRCATVVRAVACATALPVRSVEVPYSAHVRPDSRELMSEWLAAIPGIDLRRVRERLGFRDPPLRTRQTNDLAVEKRQERVAQHTQERFRAERQARGSGRQRDPSEHPAKAGRAAASTFQWVPSSSNRGEVPIEMQAHPEYAPESRRLRDICGELDERIGLRQAQLADSVQAHAINAEELETLMLNAANPYYMRLVLRYASGEERIVCLSESVRDLKLKDVYIAGIGSPLRQLIHKNSREQLLLTAKGEYQKLTLRLRRRLDIENRVIYGLQDDLSMVTGSQEMASEEQDAFSLIGKEYLLQHLSRDSSSVARSILSTISERQDELMSTPADQLLIVNGAPGSGKTAIAYNRIPLLLHEERNQTRNLQESRVAVFAPNRFLLNYLRQTLPKFGLRDVFQTTFDDWAMRVVNGSGGRQITQVTDRTFPVLLQHTSTAQERTLVWNHARMLGRVEMQATLRHLIAGYVSDAVNRLRLNVVTQRVNEPDAALLAFDFDFSALQPVIESFRTSDERVSELRQRLLKRALEDSVEQLERHREQVQASQDLLIAAREDLDDSAKREAWAAAAAAEFIAPQLRVQLLKILRGLFPWPNAWEAYLTLVSSQKALRDAARRTFLTAEEQAICAGAMYRALKKSKKGQAAPSEPTDVTELPLVLALKLILEGPEPQDRGLRDRFSATGRFDYLVVDEGQDVSPLQYNLLGHYVRKGRASVFGDLRQSIHAYRGLDDWQPVVRGLGRTRKEPVEQLTVTFRSTREITEQANAVLHAIDPALPHAEPFPRPGSPVHCLTYSHQNEGVDLLALEIKRLQATGVQRIGVVTRSPEDGLALCRQIEERRLFQVDGHPGNFEAYVSGVAVVPIAIAKGLEFDAVVVVNVDPETYQAQTPYDGPLLYTAVTRGLHHLTVLAHRSFSPLLGPVVSAAPGSCPICNVPVTAEGHHQPRLRPAEPVRQHGQERGPGNHHGGAGLVRTSDGRYDSTPSYEGDGGRENPWYDR